MWTRLRSSLSYANVVSTLCLFLVIGGGGAYAKSKLINGTELKPRSVTAAKIKQHSLTNTEVDIKKLGRVGDSARLGGKLPSAFQPAGRYLPAGGTAANANALGGQPASAFAPAGNYLPAGGTAANANALGGQPPSAYLPAGRVVSGSGAPGGQLLFTYPPLGLTAKSGSSWNVVTFANGSGELLEASRSTPPTPQDSSVIQQIPAHTEWIAASPRASVIQVSPTKTVAPTVETYVFRSVVRPTVALMVTCGFDSSPNIVNCAGIGIG